VTKSRNIMPPRRFWQWWEEELMRRHYADSLTVDLARVLERDPKYVLAKANAMKLRKNVELIAATASERSRRPDHGGARTRFVKGQAPANKGTKYPKGWAPGDMAKGQFKPGHVPSTWKPVGTQVINPDGYLDEKVSETPGPRHVRWKPVHRLVWERANGPVPAGHTVVFRPGRKTTDPELITLDALELVTRAELMTRNTIHRYGPEVASIHRLRGQIRRQINKLNEE
jgi:hypothetical protein